MQLTKQHTVETIRPENEIQGRTERSLIDFLCDSLAVLWKDWPKSMEAVYVNKSEFCLVGVCPHCEKPSNFKQVTNQHVERHSDGTEIVCAGMQCPGCRNYILAIVEPFHDHFIYREHYPLNTPNDLSCGRNSNSHSL